jgi:hypothetical protein
MGAPGIWAGLAAGFGVVAALMLARWGRMSRLPLDAWAEGAHAAPPAPP